MKVMNSNVNFFLKCLILIKISPPVICLDKREFRWETFCATGLRILGLSCSNKQLGRLRSVGIKI
ncbi:hypothetical protein OnM2_c6784o21 [Erysiphe neolycopersici]|uniref:Uncharacterized protein n=1 Tax=Erysiphe neolycopersici TaxID=212602 RepID=A0A420HIF6_9PEZI|nr:hypothetical protein OnM2_c6784o21 [Erysiphe neolycopersici]